MFENFFPGEDPSPFVDAIKGALPLSPAAIQGRLMLMASGRADNPIAALQSQIEQRLAS